MDMNMAFVIAPTAEYIRAFEKLAIELGCEARFSTDEAGTLSVTTTLIEPWVLALVLTVEDEPDESLSR
ncbi:hypothetical protein GCM10025869_12460 [Homoserinibacter gongjuensis]|uniref:Uncharacterized protein n=2 Tax=Homoserinibacter gongjuensis TaxID=1162968 RepID=A0ABQ6JR06_9MICO|nr:hypothetical protein GCM10025869_12460 [Homoserinibacter gongjuensis]